MEENKDQKIIIFFNRIEWNLNNILHQRDENQKYVVLKWELLNNIVKVHDAIQIRGYYSLDKFGKLDLTGSINVDVFDMSVEQIIQKMIETAETLEQTFICPYIGKDYHELIIEEINKIINENKRQNFPLL